MSCNKYNMFFGTDHVTIIIMYLSYIVSTKRCKIFSLPLLGPRCGSWVAGSDSN